ncbi:MAG TPA: DinB family protein [Candidatus Limnocylindrales bacterium]|nr:DinB family protein [Candidatus Limnocylindrales bacterium]
MNDAILRRELVALLETRGAHMPFEEAVADFPDDAINARPPNVRYTPWHLVEHLRLVQADLLDYVTNRDYVGVPWPEGVWPPPDATATREQFDASVAGFLADRDALRRIIEDPATDPFAAVPSSSRHTIAREIRLAGDHCAYHVGEFAILRQVMGTWPPGHGE